MEEDFKTLLKDAPHLPKCLHEIEEHQPYHPQYDLASNVFHSCSENGTYLAEDILSIDIIASPQSINDPFMSNIYFLF